MGHQPKKLFHCFQLIFILAIFSQLNIIYTAVISGYSSKNDSGSELSADTYTKFQRNWVIQNPFYLNLLDSGLRLRDEVGFNGYLSMKSKNYGEYYS